MTLSPKNLDDRTFDDLVAEAKQRIAAYTPEWTNHNDSDPGIALMQVFAWLTETTIHRLNRVPDDRMYLSFLELMGIEPAPPTAAVALVSFEVANNTAPKTLQPAELALTASGPNGDIPFEPDAAVPIVAAKIGALLVDDAISRERVDATKSNDAGARYAPFGSTTIKGRALYIGLDADEPLLPPGTSAEVQLLVRADDELRPPRTESTSFGVEDVSLVGDLVWEGWTGTKYEPLTLRLDETRSLNKTGLVRLVLPSALRTTIEAGDKDKKKRYWLRARVVKSSSAPEKRELQYIAINGARARQWRTYAKEILYPGSDGTPNQERRVLHAPILIDDLAPPFVEILGDPTPWQLVESLDTRALGGVVQREGERLEVFEIKSDRATVRFGDGRSALIPPRGANNISFTYRSGGGAPGNVSAGKIQLSTSPLGVSGVAQREPAVGGTDPESVAEAKRRAPDAIRAGDRAVTPRDFEIVAHTDGGAARAIAVNRFNPALPDVPITGALTLVVIPEPIGDETAPRPTQELLAAVSRAIEPKRVLTSEVFVIAPEYERIDVDVTVMIRSAATAAAVRAAVEKAIVSFLGPLHGGADGTGWPLGAPVPYAALLSAALRADGVESVKSLIIRHDGDPVAACSDVTLRSRLALVECGKVNVELITREARS